MPHRYNFWGKAFHETPPLKLILKLYSEIRNALTRSDLQVVGILNFIKQYICVL